MRLGRLSVISLVVALGMLCMGIGPALAASRVAMVADSEAEEIEFTGRVTVIYGQTRTLEVVVEEGGDSVTYTVKLPAGFDLTSITVGDLVEVEGTLVEGEEDVVQADKVVIETDNLDEDDDDDEDDEDEESAKGGFFCRDLDATHPAGQRIAEAYDVDYEEVMAWFCEGRGLGQIMHALRTAKAMAEVEDAEEDEDDEDDEGEEDDLQGLADTYLKMRDEGKGWGQIWRELAMTGKAKKTGLLDDEAQAELQEQAQARLTVQVRGKGGPKGVSKPKDTGEPKVTGKANGGGKPKDTGKPNSPGKAVGKKR